MTVKKILIAALLAVLVAGFLGGLSWYRRQKTSAAGMFCNNQLRQLDGAKEQVAQTLGLTNGAIVTEAQVSPYLIGNRIPECPSGGRYTLNRIGASPTCSLRPMDRDSPLHQLPTD